MEGQVHFMGGKDFLVLELLALHQLLPVRCYRGTSLITNYPLLGPYSRTVSKVMWWSEGRGGAVSHERGTPVMRGGGSVHEKSRLWEESTAQSTNPKSGRFWGRAFLLFF